MNDIELIREALDSYFELTDGAEVILAEKALAALDRIAGNVEMRGWQPIETAPMDEQEYLVTNGEKTIISKRAKDAGQHLTNKWHYFPRKHQPTHWQPLPEPPSKDGREKI